MSETTKSYRVRTNVGADSFINVSLEQEYDALDILSLKITSRDMYRLHNSNYGVIVGRVLANNGFGIPNAKISIFIAADSDDDEKLRALYPFSSTASKDGSGVRYNLLPDEKVNDCHQVVGTFPNKRYLLDNDDIIEVFDKYYKYTTRTNNAGDYIICGVPVGNQTLHMDLDLSDCGILSQRPRDFVYKGYTIEQFENPNKFKGGTSYSNLSQIVSQDQNVYVQPFWGNESLGDQIGITRADIDVAFKFEPTCVFMGCVTSDNASQGISKKCIPTPHMGDMDELISGEGKIEMIRKTYNGGVEEFQIKGTELINSDGIWCYQIPMNLDYMVTDEYGNMVPTDNPERGVPTRTRVRFRISMQDMEKNVANYFRPKVLVPHNPQNLNGTDHEDYDYEFGTYTRDDSFRDLFWNNVYTVKSYIPRFQKRKVAGWKEEKFTGIKHVQDYGSNNPMPYNNIRIRLPFMFKVMCILIKTFIKIVGVVNTLISIVGNICANLGDFDFLGWLKWLLGGLFPSMKEWGSGYLFKDLYKFALSLKMNVIDEGMCPDLENWYFSPMFNNNLWTPSKKPPKGMKAYNLLKQTLESINTDDDATSIDDQNQADDDEAKCVSIKTDYLLSCIEMNLAQEYKVINFDFYNDWINGMIYIPRFMRVVKQKRKFMGTVVVKTKVKGCMDDTKIFSKTRRYTQLCSIGLKKQSNIGENREMFSKVEANLKNGLQIIKSNNLHKRRGLTQAKIFGKNGGICHEKETMYGQFVYYLKPCEWALKSTPAYRKLNLFATDLVLLGSLNDCDMFGVPQAFKHLTNSSYIMPTNLALTNMEENGPLYAYGNKGMMCSKGNQTTPSTDTKELSNPVSVVATDSALTRELMYYSGASTNYDIQYDDELSDTMALTEAAGISWNYTGPGQGKINKKKMYYPGGHFLGLSCVNSQTNIKSCVNLERICELGTIMSQRKEDVRAIDEKDGEPVIKYIYSVPTGLISGDDIIDDDFRIMFAMMNKNRLIATKTNPKTGYKSYDFLHSTPINFGGEFSKYTGLGTPYNESRSSEIKDESTLLQKFGILLGILRPDFDEEEDKNTVARTTEFPSLDYYTFRLGLDYADLKKNNSRHNRQFGTEKNGVKYLPQYENSFYFYFGVRDGGTALDEFNKQFFSECDSSNLIERESSSYVVVGEFDLCAGYSYAIPYIKNLEGVMRFKIEWPDNTFYEEGMSIGGYSDDEKNAEWSEDGKYFYGMWENEDEIGAFILPIGKYKIIITDEEGTEVSTTFTVGDNVVSGDFDAYDFNVRMYDGNGLTRTAANSNMFYGGYVEAENIKVNIPKPKNPDDDEITLTDVKLYAVKDGDMPSSESEVCDVEGAVESGMGHCTLYVASAVTYDFYLSFKCNTEGAATVYMYISSKDFKDPSDINLTMGPVLRIGYRELKQRAMSNNWWEDYSNANDDDSEIKWNIRKSIVKTNSSAETFSNNVISTNGIKVVFGTPQNANRIYSPKKIFSTEEDDGQYVGYTLDDDATYHPFYGCANYNNSYQYNAMAYGNGVVGGDMAGIVQDDSGVTKTVTAVEMMQMQGEERINQPFRDGEGVLFKPVPNGDIISAIYDHGSIICLTDSGTAAEYTNGVVYPTICYPVIDKPFAVSASFFVIENCTLVGEEDENDTVSAKAEIFTEGGKCESYVVNGLTYEGYYGGESYMSMTEFSGNGTSKLRRGVGNDLAGIWATAHSNTYKFISGWTDEVDGVSYSIQEGAPFYKDNNGRYYAYMANGIVTHEKTAEYQNIAATCESDVEYRFYDNVLYSSGGMNSYYFGFEGVSDSDIKYYPISLSNINNLVQIPATSRTVCGYVYYKPETDKRTAFFLGKYTKKAQYDPAGGEVIIRVHKPAFGAVTATVAFTKKMNGDDDDYYEKVNETKSLSWFEPVGINIDIVDLNNMVSNIEDAFDYRISIVKRRAVVESSKSGQCWTKIENIIANGQREINTAYTEGYSSERLGNNFIVVGKKSVKEGNSTTNVYKVYMQPKEQGNMTVIPNIICLRTVGRGAVTVPGTIVREIKGPATGATWTYYLWAASGAVVNNTTWVDNNGASAEAPTWVNVDRSVNITSATSTYNIYRTTVQFFKNEDGEEREANVIFSADADGVNYEHKVHIIQPYKSEIDPRQISDIEDRLDGLELERE